MNLNYLAFFLISFVPLIIGYFWYQPNSRISQWAGVKLVHPKKLSIPKIVLLFMSSLALTYGYMNLIIHQMGFYELFFTDIMLGNKESEQIVKDFLAKYGDKHRHLGHGIFHGAINAFLFALPFTVVHAILNNKNRKYVMHNFLYWLLTSMIIGGLIAVFV
jgi:hypothetical protein